MLFKCPECGRWLMCIIQSKIPWFEIHRCHSCMRGDIFCLHVKGLRNDSKMGTKVTYKSRFSFVLPITG